MVSLTNPTYYAQTFNGNMFVGQSTAAATGIALPIATSTSPTFGLWNPAGGAVNAVLVKLTIGYVSGTWAPGSILYNNLTQAGAAVGTAAPITAFNSVTPTNAFLGGGKASLTKFTGAGTNTLTTAGTTLATSGLNIVTAVGAPELIDVIDGKIVVPPGNFFYLTASLNTTALVNASLFWYEAPLTG